MKKYLSQFLLLFLLTIFLITGINVVYANNIDADLQLVENLQNQGHYIQAKDILQNLSNQMKNTDNSLTKINVLLKYGNILRLVGNLGDLGNIDNSCNVTKIDNDTAISVLGESLKMSKKLENTKAIAYSYFHLGNTARLLAEKYQFVEDADNAKKAISISLKCYDQAEENAINNHINIPIYLNKLSFLVSTKKWLLNSNNTDTKIDTQLQETISKWSNIKNKIDNLPNNDSKMHGIFDLADSLINYNKITQNYSVKNEEIAKMLAQTVNKTEKLKSYSYGYLGMIYELQGQYEEAMKMTEQALNLLPDSQNLYLLKESNSEEMRYRWQWQKGRIQNKQGLKKEAIASYENTVQSLQKVRNNLLGLNQEVQFSFRDNVEPVYRELVELLLKEKKPNQDNLRKAIYYIDDLQLAELVNFLRCNPLNKLNNYQENFLKCNPLNKLNNYQEISGKLEQINSDKTALIYTIILNDGLGVISKLPEKELVYYKKEINKNELQTTLTELRKNLEKKKIPAVITNAKILYEWMKNPLNDIFNMAEKIENLAFVLDGNLKNIPMSVLYDGEKYLMEKKYAIAVIPSVQTIDLQSDSHPLNIFLGGVKQSKLPNFFKIEYLEEELNNIAEIKSPNIITQTPLLNRDFTKSNLEKRFKNSNISAIHIKTHGIYSSDPEKTFIVGENETITSTDLANLIKSSKSTPIKLLVLSACETAKGDKRATLGIAGLALKSGSQSILSSLWEANDKAYTELMNAFYKYLSEGKTKAKALHLAQQNINKKFKDITLWAVYVLVGNWR